MKNNEMLSYLAKLIVELKRIPSGEELAMTTNYSMEDKNWGILFQALNLIHKLK